MRAVQQFCYEKQKMQSFICLMTIWTEMSADVDIAYAFTERSHQMAVNTLADCREIKENAE